MSTTRRGFFGMVSGAIAAAFTPKPLLALAIPPTKFKMFMYVPLPVPTGHTTYLVGKDALINVDASDIRIGQWADYHSQDFDCGDGILDKGVA